MVQVARRKTIEAPQSGCGEGDILCQVQEMGWDRLGFYVLIGVIALLALMSVLRWMTGAKKREAARRKTQGLLSDEEIAAIEARADPRR